MDWLDTWKALVKLYKANPHKIRARFLPSGVMFIYRDPLGVSNLSVKFMTRLLENSDVVPAVNQIELHP